MHELKPLILLVDDERLNLNILMKILSHDYRIKVATNGDQALQRAASNPRPDLILLDIRMPGLSGYQVCRSLKRNPDTRAIPVIFLTALSEEEDEKQGLALGAVDYITKPLRPSIIQARIRTHLGLKKAHEELAQRNAELENMLTLRESVEQIARHDLKTPLNGILGSVDLLSEDAAIRDRHGPILDLLERSGYKMLEMINRSMDMLKMETGQYVLKLEPVEIIKVVQRIMTELKRPEITLTLNGRPCTPEQRFILQGEELLYYSMLSNLIRNAVEAQPEPDAVSVMLEDAGQRCIRIHNRAVVAPEVGPAWAPTPPS